MNTRLMRFNSHDYLYRSTTGETFRIMRKGHGDVHPYNTYTVYDGSGDRCTVETHNLSDAMLLCEEVATAKGE